MFQPLGASYWLVIQKAAQILQWSSTGEPEADRVYADVVQGDEVIKGKPGVLYKGTVKHLVCETDGNIVFLLLTEASRWSPADTVEERRGKKQQRVSSGNTKSTFRGKWTKIDRSVAFALEGRSIRNISFRLADRSYTEPVVDSLKVHLRETLGPYADQVI